MRRTFYVSKHGLGAWIGSSIKHAADTPRTRFRSADVDGGRSFKVGGRKESTVLVTVRRDTVLCLRPSGFHVKMIE